MPTRSRQLAIFTAFLIAVVLPFGSVFAQSPGTGTAPRAQAAAGSLKIATKPTPPFAMKTPDGGWTGMAIDLMSEVASKIGREIEWVDLKTTKELLESAAAGQVDASVAAITITSEREKTVDFTHGYYESGLAIAVRKHSDASFWAGLTALTSPAFLGTVGMLVGLLLATGGLVWLIERHQNREQFSEDPVRGIGSGFWWAAVTMTTVGYGDKAPITPLGRFIAVVWMFAALILTAVFTAQLTAALTLNRLTGPVSSLADLPRSRIGILENTASNDYFRERSIATVSYPSVSDGLAALKAEQIDAFVHDEPILRYDVRRHHLGTIELLPEVFEPQVYGVAMTELSPLREPFNRELLSVLASPSWSAIRTKYFGYDADR